MCRISSKPSHFSISATAPGLLPNFSNKQSGPPLCSNKGKESDVITFTSDLSLPLSSNDVAVESITSTEDNHEQRSLPANTRVYQSVVVEPFHQPTISLIFRTSPYSSNDTSLPLVSLTSGCPVSCHSYNRSSNTQELKENDDVLMTSGSTKILDSKRYVYKTPPPSPSRRDRILLLEPPPTPTLHRSIIDFTHKENTAAPIDLFLPLILT